MNAGQLTALTWYSTISSHTLIGVSMYSVCIISVLVCVLGLEALEESGPYAFVII